MKKQRMELKPGWAVFEEPSAKGFQWVVTPKGDWWVLDDLLASLSKDIVDLVPPERLRSVKWDPRQGPEAPLHEIYSMLQDQKVPA